MTLAKIKRRFIALGSLAGVVIAMLLCFVYFSCIEVLERLHLVRPSPRPESWDSAVRESGTIGAA